MNNQKEGLGRVDLVKMGRERAAKREGFVAGHCLGFFWATRDEARQGQTSEEGGGRREGATAGYLFLPSSWCSYAKIPRLPI